jgi:uncharacterized membrane protein YiaA
VLPFYLALVVLVALPTAIAGAVVKFPVTAVQTCVRWTALVFLNLLAMGGVWRREFSRREMFLAAWCLAFIVELFGFALIARYSRFVRGGF